MPRTRLWHMFFLVVCSTTLASVVLVGSYQTAFAVQNKNSSDNGTVFASSDDPHQDLSKMIDPEGITSWQGKIYVATLNLDSTTDNRIFVFDAKSGKLLNAIGDKSGQEIVSSGGINGLIIDQQTGDLLVAANVVGKILHIQHPDSKQPVISVYATYPLSGGGPEDMAFNKQGVLYATDSTHGLVYSILPGGGTPKLVIGPDDSGAPVSDKGLLRSPVPGITPNGMVFSLDYRTLYIANTWTDSIVAFDVNSQGEVTGNARIFAQYLVKRDDCPQPCPNPDLEEYPTGFTGLIQNHPKTMIGASASTPLNGADGLALDSQGRIWVASNLGDNITLLGHHGEVLATYGTSAVTAHGLLNQPASLTFVGQTIYSTNLGIFTGSQRPYRIVAFNVGVSGAGGNGNN